MANYTLKKELDTTELIKWGTAVFGGLVIFLMITIKDYQLKKYQILEKEAILLEKAAALNEKAADRVLKGYQIIKDYKPSIKIHYTNMLSEEGNKIQLKVYIASTAKNDVYVFPPQLTLFDTSGNIVNPKMYEANNLSAFQGSINPGASFQLNYDVTLLEIPATSINNIKLEYEVQIDQFASAPIEAYFESFGSDEEKKYFNKLKSKKYIYNERMYLNGTNPIWKDFWDNPR